MMRKKVQPDSQSREARDGNGTAGELIIVSGGQTGVDRAALEVAMAFGMKTGGWCPRGRRAEDGTIPDRYTLRETPDDAYEQRTQWNARDSDGTLVVCDGPHTGGTAFTISIATTLGRPVIILPTDAGDNSGVAAFRSWLRSNRIRVLNVAGPRESVQPGIGARACALLLRLLADSSGGTIARDGAVPGG
jgi:hypothetical protein